MPVFHKTMVHVSKGRSPRTKVATSGTVNLPKKYIQVTA